MKQVYHDRSGSDKAPSPNDPSVAVFGNVTLDVICFPVNDVPRYESIAFERAVISPGGCASNTAIGLAALGVPTLLVARVGDDEAGEMAQRYWQRAGVETRFVRRVADVGTAVSVGLVDREFQPRFVHTPGANAGLTVDDLDLPTLAEAGVRWLHVAGYFVLPGLLDGRLADALAQAHSLGMRTSLDVVRNIRMDDPQARAVFWSCLPHLDVWMGNAHEAQRLTGTEDPVAAAQALRAGGVRLVLVKLGAAGCRAEGEGFQGVVPAPRVDVVDTTGAGDAFAAGFIAATLRGADVEAACRAGNEAGARVVGRLGPVAAWFDGMA